MLRYMMVEMLRNYYAYGVNMKHFIRKRTLKAGIALLLGSGFILPSALDPADTAVVLADEKTEIK